MNKKYNYSSIYNYTYLRSSKYIMMMDKIYQLEERELINIIHQQLFSGNKDNISRTKSYQNIYFLHPEIKWAFLAAMVSRNAGWNMCDLKGKLYPHILSPSMQKDLFLTYERANWLIFRDAYPQLLIYHYSTIVNRPLFHLLDHFSVSQFMKKEWLHFWNTRRKERLLKALIINEQHTIQKPVIKHPIYRKKVFHSSIFYLQELFHFSCVIFPTLNGQLYGASIVRFRKVSERVKLGIRLANILFDPDLYFYFKQFAMKTEHTGSRFDYEKYLFPKKKRSTPMLRVVYPVIEHHVHQYEDWSLKQKSVFPSIRMKKPIHITDWFLKKQQQLEQYVQFKLLFKK